MCYNKRILFYEVLGLRLADALEELRAILFTGKSRRSLPPLTQPEYVKRFEGRIERNPKAEWHALHQYAQPIIPLYRKQLEEKRRVESYFHGKPADTLDDDDQTVLEKLYEEIMEMETEEEWQAWVRHWVQRVNGRP
ncbi:MAG: hypothetical protein LOD88_04805 [Novibacillus thermophilus]|jgi:hypothetical protein